MDLVWETQDGRMIPLATMTDDHLRNIILWMRRGAGALKQQAIWDFIKLISGPLGPQGDMAQDACDQELRDLEMMSARQWLSGITPFKTEPYRIRRWEFYPFLMKLAVERGLEIGDDEGWRPQASKRPFEDPDYDPVAFEKGWSREEGP